MSEEKKGKHTAGPWVLFKARTMFHIKGADGHPVVSLSFAPPKARDIREAYRAVAEPNAKLIASAPTLLAQRDALASVLAELVERLDGDREFVVPDGGAELLVRARAALAAVGRG